MNKFLLSIRAKEGVSMIIPSRYEMDERTQEMADVGGKIEMTDFLQNLLLIERVFFDQCQDGVAYIRFKTQKSAFALKFTDDGLGEFHRLKRQIEEFQIGSGFKQQVAFTQNCLQARLFCTDLSTSFSNPRLCKVPIHRHGLYKGDSVISRHFGTIRVKQFIRIFYRLTEAMTRAWYCLYKIPHE